MLGPPRLFRVKFLTTTTSWAAKSRPCSPGAQVRDRLCQVDDDQGPRRRSVLSQTSRYVCAREHASQCFGPSAPLADEIRKVLALPVLGLCWPNALSNLLGRRHLATAFVVVLICTFENRDEYKITIEIEIALCPIVE